MNIWSNVLIIKKYILNCFLLTLPIMLWNIILADKLPAAFQPEVFWKDIPSFLQYAENGTRILVFMLTFFMPLSLSSARQRQGFWLYLIGTLLYFAAWLLLIYFPQSSWSNSLIGFAAPAYTPLLWLLGIAWIGHAFYINIPYKPWYFAAVSILFLSFHIAHTVLVYQRIYTH